MSHSFLVVFEKTILQSSYWQNVELIPFVRLQQNQHADQIRIGQFPFALDDLTIALEFNFPKEVALNCQDPPLIALTWRGTE
jgi:hypothetical protein